MFISVQFGYNQSRLYNLNCQVAPLLDAINSGCYADMLKYIKKREEFFNKEIGGMRKKESALVKSLEKYQPVEEKKEPPKVYKKMTKEEKKKHEAEQARLAKLEAERKAKEEEEARLKAEAEEAERKRREEEEAKNKKGGKKPAKGEAEPVAEVVETEEERKEREKQEIERQLEELRAQIEAYQGKVKLCQENALKVAAEAEEPKAYELVEKGGDRKYMANSMEEQACNVLRERKAYVFAQVVKAQEAEEDEVKPIEIDGACIRTPEEDVVWAERQKELEAEAAKGAKGKPGAKKK